ncbi:MAG TPA: hypothetical protein VLE91_04015 [Candidatus Saccharimonadales bacterium]|nr:hypothetical protein [Candidatus Saccharimonadales bacterium]
MDKSSNNSIVSSLEGLFKSLPPLPATAVNGLVVWMPWIAGIFGVLFVLVGLGAFGIPSAFSSPGAATGVSFSGAFISAIGLGISGVMMLLAFPGLKAGKMNGWNLLFWSEVVNVVASVVGFSVGHIIGALIGFYLLFQIKPKYK